MNDQLDLDTTVRATLRLAPPPLRDLFRGVLRLLLATSERYGADGVEALFTQLTPEWHAEFDRRWAICQRDYPAQLAGWNMALDGGRG